MNKLFIDQGILTSISLRDYCQKLSLKWAIVTDDSLKEIYGKALQNFLNQSMETVLLTFPPGEKHKNRETKERLENELLSKGFGRDIGIIALGGGVITDLTGFLASTYCRGVPLILIPTSLLSMVDAAIGGKNGVNTPFGKNLIGTVYFPSATFIDLNMIKTLPQREICNGLSEMVKHGLIDNVDYFNYLESHHQQLLDGNLKIMKEAIEISITIKQKIVSEDPLETGKRRLLNFGHTIGHALENLTNYEIPHGEAVAIGMVVESHLAWQLGYLTKETLDRILTLLKELKLFSKRVFPYSFAEFIKVMQLDKKSKNHTPRFVFLKDIGSTLDCEGHYCRSVDQKNLEKALNWMKNDLCSY